MNGFYSDTKMERDRLFFCAGTSELHHEAMVKCEIGRIADLVTTDQIFFGGSGRCLVLLQPVDST